MTNQDQENLHNSFSGYSVCRADNDWMVEKGYLSLVDEFLSLNIIPILVAHDLDHQTFPITLAENTERRTCKVSTFKHIPPAIIIEDDPQTLSPIIYCAQHFPPDLTATLINKYESSKK